jgi:hypothetical protein
VAGVAAVEADEVELAGERRLVAHPRADPRQAEDAASAVAPPHAEVEAVLGEAPVVALGHAAVAEHRHEVGEERAHGHLLRVVGTVRVGRRRGRLLAGELVGEPVHLGSDAIDLGRPRDRARQRVRQRRAGDDARLVAVAERERHLGVRVEPEDDRGDPLPGRADEGLRQVVGLGALDARLEVGGGDAESPRELPQRLHGRLARARLDPGDIRVRDSGSG